MKKQIKIKKELWDLIVSGEKQYEFRKLSKGLTSGNYEFVSIEEYNHCSECEDWNANEYCESCETDKYMIRKPEDIYGTAYLESEGIYKSIETDAVDDVFFHNETPDYGSCL